MNTITDATIAAMMVFVGVAAAAHAVLHFRRSQTQRRSE